MGWWSRFFGDSRKRWRGGLLLILAINLFGLHFFFTPEDMTRDQENHDTRIMYKHLRYWDQPTKWLFGDWPLQNGFYRPLPALGFEADVRIWDNDFPKYKIFNWIVCVIAAFVLVAMVMSLTQSATIALGSGLFLSAWQTELLSMLPVQTTAFCASLVCCAGSLFAPKSMKIRCLAIAALVYYLGFEWANVVSLGDLSSQSFGYRTMGWPPGRTATLFGLFGLISLWGYCQWERLGNWRWLAVSSIGFIGAFMSYEQAVMLPALLTGCAIYLKLTGVRVHWAVHIVAWSLMAMYAIWHFTDLPFEERYAQQHGSAASSGVRWLLLWVYPAYGSFGELANVFDPNIGLMAFLISSFWIAVLWIAINTSVWMSARREWKLLVFGLLSSAVVFAPMAFQLRLTHYLYMPLAFRAIFVTGLTLFAWKLIVDLLADLPFGLKVSTEEGEPVERALA